MSNKTEEARTKPAAKPALVPQLRFPEFRDAEEWAERQLNQILVKISSGLNIGQTNESTGYKVTRIETISNNVIDMSKIGYVRTEQDISCYRLEIGDILFSNINSLDHIGKNVIVDRDYDLYHGMNLLRLIVEPSVGDSKFIFYLLNTGQIRRSVRSRANKAVNQASINQSELGRTPVVVPNRNEQQKIADCLSSIDEMITLEARKIKALKDHKKGLMQQLFPAEGETLPKLRFPEFQDAGEWNWKKLGELCVMRAGKFVPPAEISEMNRDGLYPCYGGNGLRGYVKTYTHSGNYPLIGRQGALCGNVILGEGKFHATEHAVVAAPFFGVNTDWLFHVLLKLDLNRFATGQAQPGLSVDVLEKVACFAPRLENEQQKIADCLSSMDELIALEAQKLDALKAHKKGLMQQLFPVSGEVRK